ncbi:unnamed protein product [Miscanthus lutarioriparius]|uniref:Uncharacterized protein n=1 Tax=Miscanthus lutarioriparius TaxID=422564 RepID=A0A811SQC8_9POAL|nr:unnamed protein product [Miscanthus lutarioriparius]
MGACVTGWMGVCRYLVEEKGFDANSTSTDGETPIFVATESNHAGVVPLLNYFLSRGGDPAAPDARGCTPLHNAAEHGHSEAIGLLLSRGIPVDPLNYHGTPLHLAAGKGHAQALKVLLEHGADPNRVVNHVSSPLLMACFAAKLECVKLLVKAGANVNFQRPPGPTMLLAAVSVGSTDIVNFLLKAGADPNIHDGCGKFPIMLAASHKRRELVKILLPRTNPIPSMPDWSVGGIIGTMKTLAPVLAEEPIANVKSEGKEAFANGDYGYAIHCYLRASAIDPHDATILANQSLCWLKLREGERAVSSAQQCRRLRPDWAKAWYREGTALSLLQKYKDAADAFVEALKLDPGNDEVENALREAMRHRDGGNAGENP